MGIGFNYCSGWFCFERKKREKRKKKQFGCGDPFRTLLLWRGAWWPLACLIASCWPFCVLSIFSLSRGALLLAVAVDGVPGASFGHKSLAFSPRGSLSLHLGCAYGCLCMMAARSLLLFFDACHTFTLHYMLHTSNRSTTTDPADTHTTPFLMFGSIHSFMWPPKTSLFHSIIVFTVL